MELTVNKDNLAKALNNVEGIASAKTSMPILENILLQTDGPSYKFRDRNFTED